MHKLRIGTRKSQLSRKQTDMAIEALQKAPPPLCRTRREQHPPLSFGYTVPPEDCRRR